MGFISENKAKRAKDDGTANEKEDDSIRDTKMVIESNVSPTMEVKEQEGVSEENKVLKKCLIFEKIIKESDYQEITPAKKGNPRPEVNKDIQQMTGIKRKKGTLT